MEGKLTDFDSERWMCLVMLFAWGVLFFLSGCVQKPLPSPIAEVKPIIEATKPTPPPTDAQFLESLPTDVALAVQQYQATGKAPLIDHVKTAGFVRFPYGLSRPELHCRAWSICDVELEPGEKILDQLGADTERWWIQPFREGPKTRRIIHVAVKPKEVIPMESDLIVSTDRRVYHLRLLSAAKATMINIKFYYPQEALMHFAQETEDQPQSKLPAVSLSDLDQHYRISGSENFKPQWVGNDGSRTYVKMADSLGVTGAPALFAEQHGQLTQINSILRQGYYVVQGVPQKMVLRKGVGRDAQDVTIVKE